MDDENDCCANAAVPSTWDVAPARAACPAAGSGSTAALGAMDDDDDCFVNAAAICPWDVAPARAASSAAGSGSTAARGAMDNKDECCVNTAVISQWDMMSDACSAKRAYARRTRLFCGSEKALSFLQRN